MTETRKLGDVVEIDRQQREGNDGIYVGMEDIESRTGSFTGDDTPRRVKSATFLFCEDHVLYGRLRPYLNKVLCPDFSGHCSTEIIPLRPAEVLDRRYLFHWLTSPRVVEAAKQTSTGARMPRANMNHLLELPMALPPLDEQRRIVAKLDEALGEIDALKRNRQAKIEAFDAVKSSMLNDLIQPNPGDAVSTWVNIGQVCEVVAGQSPVGSAYNESGDGVPFYQGKKDFTDRYIGAPTRWTTSVTKTAYEGDVLMSVRAPVGPVNVATQEVCIGRGLAAIRAGHGIEHDYLYYALKALQPTIEGNAGAVFASINKRQIEALRIPLPPLDEQRRIVAKLDQAASAADSGQSAASKELELADAMASSLMTELLTAA